MRFCCAVSVPLCIPNQSLQRVPLRSVSGTTARAVFFPRWKKKRRVGSTTFQETRGRSRPCVHLHPVRAFPDPSHGSPVSPTRRGQIASVARASGLPLLLSRQAHTVSSAPSTRSPAGKSPSGSRQAHLKQHIATHNCGASRAGSMDSPMHQELNLSSRASGDHFGACSMQGCSVSSSEHVIAPLCAITQPYVHAFR